MTTITFDTLKFVRWLKAAGVSETHAEAEAEALAEVFSEAWIPGWRPKRIWLGWKAS